MAIAMLASTLALLALMAMTLVLVRHGGRQG